MIIFSKYLELSFFSQKKIISNVMLWVKKDNSKLRNVYNVIMFTNKDFYEWFQFCVLLNPFQIALYIFGRLSARNLLEFHVKQFW